MKKVITLLPISLFALISLSGCANNNDEIRVLRVLNSEDYIYEYFPEYAEDEMDDRDLMDQFVDYWKETTGETIDYVYDTFDTNETLFNELKTGKTTYDIIVPSDYMVQKLISNDMLEPFDDNKIDDVWGNISEFLVEKFEKIIAVDDQNNPIASIYDYSIPYMWGTMGLMYNPDYYLESINSVEHIHELFKEWDSLYNDELSGSFSIKNSVRDSYAISLIHEFGNEIASVKNNDELTNIFNQHDEKTIARVKADMMKLKDNAFGFETDSGKTDMTTEKIGANMCWSGDATWAITEARDNGLELYYSIPTNYNGEENKGASNIWFDCLCMPKSKYLNKDIAQGFIEFMCDPENAMQNCYAVGYTPGVAGDAMLDYIYDCYDIRGEVGATDVDGTPIEDLVEGEDYIKYDISYFFENSLSDEYASIIDVAVLMADPDYVDRELTAQYPSVDLLDRLAIMNDFGTEGTIRLLDMWEQVRTNPLPVWGIVVFVIEGVIALAIIGYFVSKKIIRRKFKKIRSVIR